MYKKIKLKFPPSLTPPLPPPLLPSLSPPLTPPLPSVLEKIGNSNNKMKIGFTTSKNSIIEMLEKSDTKYRIVGCYQICMSPLQSFVNGKPFTKNEALKIKELKEKHNIDIVVHGKYVYNFCRIDGYKKIDVLINELKVSNDINADVIIHQGSNIEKHTLDKAIQLYVDSLKQVISRMKILNLNNRIILENSAGEGNYIGYDLDTLSKIYNLFNEEEKTKIGFCIDTCHIFASGELDMRNPNSVEQFMNRFDHLIGIDKLKVIHLNDSKTDFLSKVDNHADIGYGYISKKSMEGFKMLKKIAIGFNIPLILETKCDDISYYEQIKLFIEL